MFGFDLTFAKESPVLFTVCVVVCFAVIAGIAAWLLNPPPED